MIRNVDLKEISDGRLYSSNDMVKADCQDCKGCSKCCTGMGDSIKLDPYDGYRLSKHLKTSMSELLKTVLEVRYVDGLLIPNIKMDERDCCPFLNEQGRCSIHEARTGFCRMFPLGRFYEENGFRYFLQVHECPKEPKMKIKVKKWIDTPMVKEYEAYINCWHQLQKQLQVYLQDADAEEQKNTGMYALMLFYVKPYDETKDFYPQFYDRVKEIQSLL